MGIVGQTVAGILSSGTTDGGNSWQDADHIGLFLNRFRFFGSPVSVGYASGDTIYKYSADPVESTAVHLAATTGRRPLLPQAQIPPTAYRSTFPWTFRPAPNG